MGKLLMDYEQLHWDTEKKLGTAHFKDLKYFQDILDILEELADLKNRVKKVNQYLERIRLVSK